MHFNIITLFPEFFNSPLSQGLIKKAIEKNLLSFSFINPRDYTRDRHRSVDDRPYGGGAGMVMMVEPLYRAISSLDKKGRLILFSPRGTPLTHRMARSLSKEEIITFICGRYEGIDARIEEIFSPLVVSIGDFVLNGGESACICAIEAISRFIPGFMGKQDSAMEESFSSGILEYPHYTRPETFMGHSIPPILLSGHHENIRKWRRKQALIDTLRLRPELLERTFLSPEDYQILRKEKGHGLGKNLYVALVHHPVLNNRGETTTVSLTNLDIHDIARVCKTYGISGFFLVTPIRDQMRLARRLISHWLDGPGKGANPHREEALKLVKIVESVSRCEEIIEEVTGYPPVVFATSARDEGDIPYVHVRKILSRKKIVLLLFGTGHGLAPSIMESVEGVLRPLRAFDSYRHLSVRSAVSIVVDRILGDVW